MGGYESVLVEYLHAHAQPIRVLHANSVHDFHLVLVLQLRYHHDRLSLFPSHALKLQYILDLHD